MKITIEMGACEWGTPTSREESDRHEVYVKEVRRLIAARYPEADLVLRIDCGTDACARIYVDGDKYDPRCDYIGGMLGAAWIFACDYRGTPGEAP